LELAVIRRHRQTPIVPPVVRGQDEISAWRGPLPRGVIDLHSHILPGIDDGARTLGDSIAIARAAVRTGTATVVATPHVSWSWPDNNAAAIRAGVAELRDALSAAAVPLDVWPGAEVALTRAIDLPDVELRELRLGKGPWLLIECPSTPSAAGFEEALYELSARGHRIVLSHPERCPAFHGDEAVLERLVATGVLGSITAGALRGRFGRRVRTFAAKLLARGLAHNVASDAHDVDRRPPGLVAELEAAGLGPRADWLVRDVPAAVITGRPVPPPPPPPAHPGRRSRGQLRRRAKT
jgi:protein-tyrosine phosphatase